MRRLESTDVFIGVVVLITAILLGLAILLGVQEWRWASRCQESGGLCVTPAIPQSCLSSSACMVLVTSCAKRCVTRENADCRKPLHPQWSAVYGCNDFGLEDV